MTRLKAANARTAAGDAAMQRQDYAAAARDYTLAAEQLETIWHEMHGARGRSPDAQNMRRRASLAIAKRDGAPVIKIDGRIGGWQS